MSASAQIKELLDASGMTKSQLSARSGVSRSLVDDYLKGRRQPTMRQLERLGAAAGMRLDVRWQPLDRRPLPRWARPSPAMKAPPLTIPQRAEALEQVVAVGAAMQRPIRRELQFPPFRTLRRTKPE